MSALDRAFIKAYAKDAEPHAGPRLQSAPETARAASPYDTGPFYRVDVEPTAAAPAVPPSHQRFARTGNSLRSRYTVVQPQDEAYESEAPQPVERLLADVRPMIREPQTREPLSSLPPVVAPLPQPLPPAPEPPRTQRAPGLDSLAKRLVGGNDQPLDLPFVVEEPQIRVAPPSFVESFLAEPPSAQVTLTAAAAPSDFAAAPSILVFTPALDLAAEVAVESPAPVVAGEPARVPSSEPIYRVDSPSAALAGPHFKLKPAADKSADKPAEIAAPAKQPTPAWEVDAFQWPEVCQKLLADSHSYFAQAGAKLTAAVKDGLHTLGVAGSARGEGASTLTLSLAKAALASGLKVAVVDADFADPQLAVRLGLDIDTGWEAAANGHIPLTEAAVHSLSDKVTLYPLRKDGSLALTDPWAVSTLRKIQESYDLVLVDLGPIAAGDAPLFAKDEAAPFDAVVIVRDIRRTPLDHAQAVASRLYTAGIEAVGIAENFVN